MKRLISTITLFILITGCSSPVITKEAAQVAFHTQMTQLLDDCKRLGPIKVEHKIKQYLNSRNNELQAKYNMRQMAYENYNADNVVFINSEFVEGVRRTDSGTIYAQGVAFKCDK